MLKCSYFEFFIMFLFDISFVYIQKSERHLPSFETIAYAVKSISQKFNWTEAIIFAGK